MSRRSEELGFDAVLLREALPALFEELVSAALSEGRADLSCQLAELRLDSRCGCRQAGCATIYVSGGKSRVSPREKESRGPYSRSSVILELAGGDAVLELDRLDRVKSIELLDRPDLSRQLDTLTWLVQNDVGR